MTRISDETRRTVVRANVQDGRTIASLVAEYGISRATVSNWVRSYREECQNNDEEESRLKMMDESRLRRLKSDRGQLRTGKIEKSSRCSSNKTEV